MSPRSDLDFVLPVERMAAEPPEVRGIRRDQVRLLVAGPGGVVHSRFDRLDEQLRAGDLLVVNTSPTMRAALTGTLAGRNVVVHLSTRRDDGSWTVEVRRPDRRGPILDLRAGDTIHMRRAEVRLISAVPGSVSSRVRLWVASVDVPGGLERYLHRHGRPIRYSYTPQQWPIAAYQTIFADPCLWPGSAEMPSAGRPFSRNVLARLRRRSVAMGSIELHTGVSSQEADEPPQPERFSVPEATAAAIAATRAAGGKVIAVGTTVTRALESAVREDGRVVPVHGWTDLVLSRERPASVVDGLITGWHPPGASHLQLLEAVAGRDFVTTAYEAALGAGYLWHEFGDSALLMPNLPERS